MRPLSITLALRFLGGASFGLVAGFIIYLWESFDPIQAIQGALVGIIVGGMVAVRFSIFTDRIRLMLTAVERKSGNTSIVLKFLHGLRTTRFAAIFFGIPFVALGGCFLALALTVLLLVVDGSGPGMQLFIESMNDCFWATGVYVISILLAACLTFVLEFCALYKKIRETETAE